MEKIQDQIDLSISLFIENKFSSPFEVRHVLQARREEFQEFLE